MLKRFFDVILALVGIIILTPLGLVISILIVLNSGLPVFFVQNRVGQHKKGFRLIKFRTMIVRDSAKLGSFDAGDSSRVTAIGRILRKLKLDELPQLFNVLKGDMSLVGPRPEVEKWVAVYPERWEKVLSVVPGITDNASIEFRREEDLLALSDQPEKTYKEVVLPRKLKYYEDYVDNQSFGGDIKLIFKTIYFSLFK